MQRPESYEANAQVGGPLESVRRLPATIAEPSAFSTVLV